MRKSLLLAASLSLFAVGLSAPAFADLGPDPNGTGGGGGGGSTPTSTATTTSQASTTDSASGTSTNGGSTPADEGGCSFSASAPSSNGWLLALAIPAAVVGLRRRASRR